MFCSDCGKDLTDDAKFCADCGTAVKVVADAPPPPSPALNTQEEIVSASDTHDAALNAARVIIKSKSVGLSALLTLFFGPLGMFYSTIIGGLSMLVLPIPIFIGMFTGSGGAVFGIVFFVFYWLICMIWGMIAASSHNKALLKAAKQGVGFENKKSFTPVITVIAIAVLASILFVNGGGRNGGSTTNNASSSEKLFLNFLNDLKSASLSKNIESMANLMLFPVRVNSSPNYEIISATDLNDKFPTVFNDKMLKAITDQKPENFIFNDDQAMIGNGLIWIRQQEDKIGIFAINLPSDTKSVVDKPAGNVFTCKTEKHTIFIDEPSANSFRYRSWNIPKDTGAKPDMEVLNGSGEVIGTGICTKIEYSFKTGKVEFQVRDGANCGGVGTPENAIGDLTVLISGELKDSYYCVK